MGYRAKLEKELAKFAEDGIISRAQADQMLSATPLDRRVLTLFNVLIVLASILFCAALFSFIAANWDEIPRIWRVGLVLFITCLGYVGGGVLLSRGYNALGQGAVLLGLAAFGAGLALIGQMYHVLGSEVSAALLWTLMALTAMACFRVSTASVSAVLLTGVYLVMALDDTSSWHNFHFIWLVPLILTIIVGYLLFVQSKSTGYLLGAVALLYAVILPAHFDAIWLCWPLAAIAFAKFFFNLKFHDFWEAQTGLGETALFYSAATGLAALFILQIDYDDQLGLFMGVAMLVIIAVVGLLYLANDFIAVRWLSYAAFAFEVIYLYIETVGSILGTAGFFFALALFVLFIAFVVYTVEKRMRQTEVEGEAA